MDGPSATTRPNALARRIGTVVRALRERPRLLKALQALLVVITLGFCAWAVRSEWSDAWPRLQHARPGYVALSFLTVGVYYLVFILGWMRLLSAWGIRISYRVALQSE